MFFGYISIYLKIGLTLESPLNFTLDVCVLKVHKTLYTLELPTLRRTGARSRTAPAQVLIHWCGCGQGAVMKKCKIVIRQC